MRCSTGPAGPRRPGTRGRRDSSCSTGRSSWPPPGTRRSRPGPPATASGWDGLLRAPALVLVTTDPQRYLARYDEADKAGTGRGRSVERWPVPYWWVDAGAVVQNLLLLVVQADLGACLFGPFDHEPAIRRCFGLDPTLRIVATVAIGHPLPDQPGRSAGRARPPLDRVVVRPTIPGRSS